MMTSQTRLRLSICMVMLSTIYGIIVALSYSVAANTASWYVAILLIVFTVSNLWKKQ
jgi:hypothetical protein